MNRVTEKICSCCKEPRPFSSYFKSPLEGEDEVKFCKRCCNLEFNKIKKATKSEYAALWCIMVEMGIPVVRDNMDYVEKINELQKKSDQAKKMDIVALYLKGLISSGAEVHGVWETNVSLGEYYTQKVKMDKVEVLDDQHDYRADVKVWGRYTDEHNELDTEAYDYMNDSYEKYTADLGDIDTNLENRYRDLVKAEWHKRKADESGDIQAIAKAQDNLKKMLEMLKLNNFQDNNVSNEQRAFEKVIAMIEQTDPAECEDLQEYLDMVGYERDKATLMRSLRNAIAGTREYPDISPEDAV